MGVVGWALCHVLLGPHELKGVDKLVEDACGGACGGVCAVQTCRAVPCRAVQAGAALKLQEEDGEGGDSIDPDGLGLPTRKRALHVPIPAPA